MLVALPFTDDARARLTRLATSMDTSKLIQPIVRGLNQMVQIFLWAHSNCIAERFAIWDYCE
jgi:hypothetical protein